MVQKLDNYLFFTNNVHGKHANTVVIISVRTLIIIVINVLLKLSSVRILLNI